MAQIQYQRHSHCFPPSPSTTPGCCTIMQKQQIKDELPSQNMMQSPPSISNNNHSSSIIGYTRVPFFTFSPASSIVPVKQTKTSSNGAFTCLAHFSSKQHQQNNNKNEDRLCQRIFKREQNHGMMELIQEHNNIKKQKHKKNSNQDQTNNSSSRCCNIVLSIDISGQKVSSFSPTSAASSTNNINISMLIDSISKMADLYAVRFESILYLLEQLQRYGGNKQFKALLKKEDQTIWIYFPRTIFPPDETPTIDHAYQWLIQALAINVNDHNNWEIIDMNSILMDRADDDDDFNGANYFRDIHMFLDHVDQMMESNHLFNGSTGSTQNKTRHLGSR